MSDQTLGHATFAWCKALFNDYPDAVQPVFQSICPEHGGHVVGTVTMYHEAVGPVRVAALRDAYKLASYQIYFDRNDISRYYSVAPDGQIWGARLDNDQEIVVGTDLTGRLRQLVPIPVSLFGYVEDGSVRALVNFCLLDEPDDELVELIFGLQGTDLPALLNTITLEQFWELHAAGSIVPLAHVLAKGACWDLCLPAAMVKQHDAIDALVDDELLAILWEGPAANSLPPKAMFVYAPAGTARCATIVWPLHAEPEFFGTDQAPSLKELSDSCVMARGLVQD